MTTLTMRRIKDDFIVTDPDQRSTFQVCSAADFEYGLDWRRIDCTE